MDSRCYEGCSLALAVGIAIGSQAEPCTYIMTKNIRQSARREQLISAT